MQWSDIVSARAMKRQTNDERKYGTLAAEIIGA
jgi:hypothetical protein